MRLMTPQNRTQPAKRETLVWNGEEVLDHGAIASRLPVIENTYVQTGRGPCRFNARIVSNGEVTVGRALIGASSVAKLILKPESIGFYVPTTWSGDLFFNGVKSTPNAIHMPVDDVYFHVRGRQREVLGCILPRRQFIETVAALRGLDPDSLDLHERNLELDPQASVHLRRRLAATLNNTRQAHTGSRSSLDSLDLTNVVFESIVDAYLRARPDPIHKSGRVSHPGRIVRAAEERFEQAGNEPVSLADLCAAAGVGKSTLYSAFESWCGQPPINYFHKRRLMKARKLLLDAEPGKGAVTSAALSAGITELGRFSREYWQLFGELPSITLNRSIEL